MSIARWLAAVGLLLLLLPATLFFALLVVVSYPAYPLESPGLLQWLFDLGMLAQLLGLIAGWRVAVAALAGGRGAVRRLGVGWLWLLGVGAAIGAFGAAIAIEHLLAPRSATDIVGFALLAGAVVLVPAWIASAWARR